MKRLFRPLIAMWLMTGPPLLAQTTVYFGTYTRGESEGIYQSSLNEDTGELSEPQLAARIENPSFLALHPMTNLLFAVSETKDGTVSAFAIESDGTLRLLNTRPTGGPGPCHVSVDPSGSCVLVANYGGGSCAALPIGLDGSLGPAGSVQQHSGSSVNPKRQAGPHAHSILPDSPGHRALVADLGLDRILIYDLDATPATLVPHDPPSLAMPPGGGPRHIAFHPRGRFAYCNLELTSRLTALTYDAETGALGLIESRSTLPSEFEGNNSTAETLVHPSGRFVYVSNRGHHSIAAFSIDQTTGQLTYLENEPTQGEVPRNFGITRDGRFLLAANQNSGNVTVFRIDPETGLLDPTGSSAEVPNPVCVRFHRR